MGSLLRCERVCCREREAEAGRMYSMATTNGRSVHRREVVISVLNLAAGSLQVHQLPAERDAWWTLRPTFY